MSLISFVLGAASGFVVARAISSISVAGSGGQTTHTGEPPSVLAGKIVPNPEAGLPVEAGLLPQKGLASREGYEWGYVVGPGDSAGSIARAITGDDGRYQELVAANPHLPTIGEAGVYLGDQAYDFASALVPGEAILLPVPWSRYVDELGNARGGTTPFPPDQRLVKVVSSGLGTGTTVEEYVYSPPPPRALTSAGSAAPYGEVLPFEEAA